MCFEFRHISQSVNSFFSLFFYPVASKLCLQVDDIGLCLPLKPFLHIPLAEWMTDSCCTKTFLSFILPQCCDQSTTILELLWQRLSFYYYMCAQWNSSTVDGFLWGFFPQKFDSVLYHKDVGSHNILLFLRRLIRRTPEWFPFSPLQNTSKLQTLPEIGLVLFQLIIYLVRHSEQDERRTKERDLRYFLAHSDAH